MNEKHMLIYGLCCKRLDYYYSLIGKDQKPENIPLFIDRYNNHLSSILYDEWLKKVNRNKVQITGWDSKKSFSNFIEETSRSKENREKYPLWKEYLDHFQSQRPTKNLPELYNDLLKKAQKKDCSSYDLNIYPHLKRGCKIGLEMAKTNEDLIIQFILDDIDFEEVLSKVKGYTSKELRYTYRNWEELKDKVIFIENNERAEAPWEKDPELWKNYQPKKKQELSNLESEKKNQELNDVEPEKKDRKRSELEQKKKIQDLNNPQIEKKAHLEITKTSQSKNKQSLIKRMENGIWKRIKNVFPHSNKKPVDLHKNLPNIENGKTSPVVARSYRQYPLPQTSRSSESKLKHDIKLSQITSKGLNERKKRNKKATHSLMIE